MIFFSIIIPTYNSATTVQKCIESILNQTFTNFEILLIDAVSTDNTLELIRTYNDTRVKILSEPDKGIYDAMNKGIRLSKGKWLYFLGSDDTLFDNKVLQDVFLEIGKKQVDIIYGNVLMMKSGVINDGEFNYEKIQRDPICHQAIFYKKRVFDYFGGYNLRYKVLADIDFNLKWFFSDKHKNLFIDRLIARYSETGFSSVQKDASFYDELPEKLVCMGRNKLSTVKLKENAIYAAINNKAKGNYLKSIYYKMNYIYYRLVDILIRKIKL